MRKIIVGVILTLIFVFAFRYCENKRENREQLTENSALIQLQIQNVGKLIVTEGHFSQVFTYEDSKKYFFDAVSARKKAIVIVNANVTVAYDLSQIETAIDEENKTVSIIYIPEKEITIHPTIEYYDVTQDYLNQFEARDFNIVKSKVDQLIKEKIENSSLKSNAQNRLISELQKVYVLTNTMGWTLRYNSEEVRSPEVFTEMNLSN
ncbi:DUF4230 domain-containing protein [Planktosalinus lacus]|uniref:DUF4230 domain-containing protein n=1 Tax=Planktosalinus lacus TaxID=1526573 RepID=A0A8J2V8S2_9FLAO|nr:DUF4230 domain-containing protein [Planktosalinus lacus]GGD86621.1 hypothetical protein GCM10011312_08320 [Planktosalinus lacus]